MGREGTPAYDAGEALAQGRFDVLRRALDRWITPKSALVEAISDRVIDLGVELLEEWHEEFVQGVIAGAASAAGSEDAR